MNEILDYNKIDELRNLDPDNGNSFLNELIDLYISQLIELKNDIKSSFYKNEFSQSSKSSHSLKGASLNLGANALADICKKIEISINENQTANIEELIVQLDDISKITIETLEKARKHDIEKIMAKKWTP